jgi:integrase
VAQVIKRTTARGGARYDVRWRLPDGAVRTKTFSRRKDADTYLTQVEHDRITGVAIDPSRSRMLFEELTKRWLAHDPGKRGSTLLRDRSVLSRRIEPVLGKRTLASIRPSDVQSLVNGWSNDLAPGTVHRFYAVLRAVMSYAVADDRIARSPCRNVKLPPLRRQKRPELTPDDVAAIAEHMDRRYRSMVWVGALLGLRWGEIAALRVGSLDPLAGTLTVSENVTLDERGRTRMGPPKSDAGHRTFTMPAALVTMLADHLAQRRLTAADTDALLFPAPDGGLLQYTAFRNRFWLPAVKDTDLATVRPHDLRRLAATELVRAKVDLKTAQTRLGHSDPRLTLAVYAQATTEADKEAAEALQDRFAEAMRPRHERRKHSEKNEPAEISELRRT